MSKKHFIALADHIRSRGLGSTFTWPMVEALADWCASQNPSFMRDRWFRYIRGECGPSGGARHAD